MGTVVSLVERAGELYAEIEVDTAVACERCASGKGCGAGILGSGGGPRLIGMALDSNLRLQEGDRVRLALAPDNVLRAALIVYGIPMLAAVAGATAAFILSLGDAMAAVAALAGLGAGAMISRQRLGRAGCLRQFTPTVERVP